MSTFPEAASTRSWDSYLPWSVVQQCIPMPTSLLVFSKSPLPKQEFPEEVPPFLKPRIISGIPTNPYFFPSFLYQENLILSLAAWSKLTLGPCGSY